MPDDVAQLKRVDAATFATVRFARARPLDRCASSHASLLPARTMAAQIDAKDRSTWHSLCVGATAGRDVLRLRQHRAHPAADAPPGRDRQAGHRGRPRAQGPSRLAHPGSRWQRPGRVRSLDETPEPLQTDPRGRLLSSTILTQHADSTHRTFACLTIRQARVSLDHFLSDVGLVIETIETFSPEQAQPSMQAV